ncbi:MAG: ABC transporter ATP-binding protein, partial [Lachnospiraceae bacterium]|nr:ABC transporter ATP-binding protein [Lachnospiraceae bacterium]
MDIVKKLRYILDRKQKINICFLGVMIFIGGLLETLSVSAILPVVWVMIDPVQAQENRYMKMIMRFTGIEDVSSLIVPLLGLLILMYVLKNSFLLLLASEQNRFI